MDYDLFQSDDDEDLLSAVLEATIPAKQQQPTSTTQPVQLELGYDLDVLPEFNCSGRDTLKTQFSSTAFIRNGYGRSELAPPAKLDNLAFDFEQGQLQVRAVLGYLLGQACKNVQQLCAAVTGQQQLQPSQTPVGWFKTRQQVTHCYHLFLHDPNTALHWPALRQPVSSLRELLNQQLAAPLWRILYFAEHAKGNECSAPAYHLYHGVLEWRLLDLCLLYKYELQGANPTPNVEQAFLAQLERLLDDLVLAASYHHRSRHSAELPHNSAFMCRCIKECWLLLLRLVPLWLAQLPQFVAAEEAAFWPLFHRAMQRHKAKQQAESTPGSAVANHELHAWLRLSVARLGAYDELGHYVATPTSDALPAADVYRSAACLQEFLACQPDEQQRRVYLCLLAPLQLQWARPSSELLCQLWECLHRSLNCNFQIAPAQLQQLPLICASGAAYLERYRTLLAKPQLEDLNLSSFTLFALLLGKTLPRLPAQGNQSQKVLGRIFSKFSAAKLLALNEAGIHHLIELFLCMLLSQPAADFSELARKLREMLLCLTLDKLLPARRLVAAKGHMALLQLHAERRLHLGDYLSKLLAQLTAARNDPELAAIYATALSPVLSQADDFARGEQQLLAPWLTHYLEHSAQAAQERIFQTLHTLFEDLAKPRTLAGNTSGMWDALQQHILPLLRQLYAHGHSDWLPKLAADFCRRDKTLLLGFLKGAEPVNSAASAQLLLHLLQGGTDTVAACGLNDAQVLQVWVKSLVLLTAQHEAVLALTPHVQQLAEFRALNIEASALESREPLCAFFGALGRRAQQLEGNQSAPAHLRMQLSHKLHAYVAHFELWLPPERLASERPELCLRFYSFLAIVIYNCAGLAYVRSRPSCFFHLAMARYLLPTHIQAGAAPEGRMAQLMHKIFPVLLQGIGKLPYRTDSYVNWALHQLALSWTPHFSFSPSVRLVARPYSTLLQADAEGELSQYVLQQLAQQFLAVQRRQAGAHAGLLITLLQQLIAGLEATTATATATTSTSTPTMEPSGEAQLLTLLRATHVPLLEHIMFVDELEHSRQQVLGLYRVLVGHPIFQRSTALRESCAADIRTLAEKHLAHCTYFYFQMLIKLAEQAPQLVAPLLPFVREQALGVELKRDAGEDAGIRKCLSRLQQTLQGRS